MMRTFLRLFLITLLSLAVVDPATAQAWRNAAQARIEQHRKGTLRIAVKDADGQPVPNAEVHVKMKRHAFGFGTAISAGMFANTKIPQYRAALENLTGDGRSFNMAVYGNAMKWPYWEGSTNKTQIVSQLLWFRSRGYTVRGHTLLWPAFQWLPADIEQNKNNPAYVRNRIENHIRAIAGYRNVKGALVDWDVLNEPAHLTDIRDIFKGTEGYPTGEEIYAEIFQWAAEADPNAHLYINDYNIINGSSSERTRYKQIIQNLIDAGAPLYGIGMQGHLRNTSAPAPETVYDRLEEFAVFGKRIAITEYDLTQIGQKIDETFAANYLRDFLTVVFSHPAVESFTMWGFWDGDHWRDDAPIFRTDWTMKPAGEAFIDLVFNQWWTDEMVTTNAEGIAEVRGFLGEYELSTEVAGEPLRLDLKLSDTGTTEIELSATATPIEAATDLPQTVELAGNYPNPFSGQTTIRYGLPSPSPVRLVVYDVLGRAVATLVEGEQAAGWHEVAFDGSALPNGTYSYRLTAGVVSRTGHLSLVK